MRRLSSSGRDPRQHDRGDQARAQADEREPAHVRRRARRSTVSGSATRANAIGPSCTRTAAYMRPDARRVALARGRCLRPSARRRPGLPRASRGSRASADRPSRPRSRRARGRRRDERHARRGCSAPSASASASGSPIAGRCASSAAASRACVSRLCADVARTRYVAQRPLDQPASRRPARSAVASSTPTNVRVRKVTTRRRDLRACSRTA